MIRVVMAEDHPLVRRGLKDLLAECTDLTLASEVENGNDLLQALRSQPFDVVLMDMSMPGRNGIELLKQVKSENPKLPVVVLSAHKEDMFAVRALKAGASAYLCKDAAATNLVAALRKAAMGGCFISPEVAELMAKNLRTPSEDTAPHTLLSDREYQVFLLLAKGLGLTEIAEQLNLSVKTVSTHKTRIRDKTKLSNVSDLVQYAIKHSLINPHAE